MTLHDVQRLNNHWQRHPPLRVLVAACASALGIKFPSMQENKPNPMTYEEAKRMIAITRGRIDGIGGI